MLKARSGSRVWSPDVPFRPASWPFFYGWVVTAMGTLAMIATSPGQTMGVGVFNEPMMRALGLSRLQMSIAYLAGTVLGGFLLPRAGRLLDRAGARRTMTWTCFLFGLALGGMSQVDKLAGWVSAWFGAAIGGGAAMLVLIPSYFLIRFLGQGMLAVSANTMRAKWFNRWRGVVLAGGGVFVNLAFSVVPLAFHALIEQFGWRGAWMLLGGFLFFVMAPLCWVFCRDNPEECGLVMDGRTWPEGSESKNTDLVIRREFTVREAVRTYSFWVLTLVLAWQAFFATGYTFNIEDIARTVDVPKKTMFGLFVPAAPIVIVVSLISGWLVDRTRIKYFGTVMASGSCLMAAGLYLMPGPGAMALTVVGMGISGGCFGLLMNNTNPRFFGRLHLGAINGLASSIMVIASALGPATFSVSRAVTGGYHAVFVPGIAAGLALALAAFKADNPQQKVAAGE